MDTSMSCVENLFEGKTVFIRKKPLFTNHLIVFMYKLYNIWIWDPHFVLNCFNTSNHMTSNAIDYFATLGRKSGPFSCKSFKSLWSDDNTLLSPSDIWNDAITDIAVCTQGDQDVDDGWEILSTSIDGHELEWPRIAIKRRISSKRLDHIVKMKFVQQHESLPVGFELIKSSFSGSDSALFKSMGYIALRRADTSSVMFIEGEPLLDDICIVMKAPSSSEELPAGYKEVERSSLHANATNFSASAHPVSSFVVGYHQRGAVGLCDLGYDSATLDRYPQQDYGGLSLPVNELPMFAFPNDLRLTYSSLNRFPLPVFFTFVFTDQNGGHLYAACLRFYEVVPVQDLLPVFKEVYGVEQKLEILPGSEIFCPKVVCVVSKRPFYRAMRRFLRQIYSLSLSALACPLEYFVSALVNQVPLPIEGGRPFHVMLDSALISATSRPMAPIVLELPLPRFFPQMDLDFAGPLRCLSVDHLLAVFTLLLREAKVLFICSSNTMLTDAMESLRALLFPLSWASCFVSRLPVALGGLLEAPGGFMIGIHVMEESADLGDKRPGSAKNSDWHQSATRNYAHQLHTVHNIVPGTYIVDLSANTIYQFDGKTSEHLSAHNVDLLLKTLPVGPRQRLKVKLQKIAGEYRIGPQTMGFEEFDSAFDFQSQDDSQVTAKKWEEFPTLEVRDSFMVFMIDLLGDYTRYIIPPMEDMAADSYRTFKEEFSVADYLEDSDAQTRACLEHLMETQMFAVLLQERSEGSHYAVVFFEQASALLRQLGLSAGGHNCKLLQSVNMVSELPAPLFELLEAESRWAALSRAMQQQLLHSSILITHNSHEKSASPVPRDSAPHPHQLSMITITTSSLSPLRGAAAKVVQPVRNEKLNDLLTMHKIMCSSDVVKRVALDDGGSNQSLSKARQELNLQEPLNLQIIDYGPLVIPGPVLSATTPKTGSSGSESDSARDGEEEAERRVFSYAAGWPTFDPAKFAEAQSSVHPRLKEIRKLRLFAMEQVNKRILMFVRTPAERLAFEHEGKLHTKSKSGVHDDVSAVVSAILDVASISVTMLATRVLRLQRPTADVLQMLGVIAQIESWGLSHEINESVWRSVIIACAAGGGDLMRRIACAVFEAVSTFSSSPDALTYGQYIQALAARTANKSAEETAPLDQFLFLEEMGHIWFVQRTALIERAQIDQDYAGSMGDSGSPSVMFSKSQNSSKVSAHQPQARRSSWGLSEATPKGLSNVNSKKLAIRGNTSASEFVSEQFALTRSSGLLVFLCLPRLVGVCSPRLTSSFVSEDSKSAVPGIDHDVQERLEKISADALLSITKRRVHSTVGRARGDSSASTSSMLSTATGLSFSSQTATTPTGGIMSRLYGAAKQSASSTTASVSHAVSSAVSNGGSSPMGEGWSKRLGASIFHRTSTTTPVKSPLPPVHSPPPSNLQSSSAHKLTPLKELAEKLNFDDEDDSGSDDDNRDSVVIRAAVDPKPSSVSEVTVKDAETTEVADGIAAIDLQSSVNSNAMSTVAPSEEPHKDTDDGKEIGTRANLTLLPVNNSAVDESSSPTKPSAINVIDLQDRILAAFEAQFALEGEAVGIHSCTACGCGHCFLDEEVMAAWCAYQGQDVHFLPAAQATRATKPQTPADVAAAKKSRDMVAAHKLICPQCVQEFLPMLHVRNYRVTAHPHEVCEDRSCGEGVTSTHSEDVLLISPFGLRFELEELIQRVGESVCDAEWLHTNKPELYWGIVWYSNRFNLPSGFVVGSSSSSAIYMRPVVVGWRESVVKARVSRLLRRDLTQGADSAVCHAPALVDIFPQCNVVELAIMRDVVAEKMDGSPAGMRAAIMELHRCKNIFLLPGSESVEAPNELPVSAEGAKVSSRHTARALYVTLLTLAFRFRRTKLVDTTVMSPASSTDIVKGLMKDFAFDKVFVDAIKWVMSKADFAELRTSEADLLSFVGSRDVQIVRTGFGFHY